MTVGLAKNLEGDIYVEGKTYFKPTATVVDDEGNFTSEEVGSGPATIETIQGNTVVWNQNLPPLINSSAYSTIYYSETGYINYNNDDTATVVFTNRTYTPSNVILSQSPDGGGIRGHKYLVSWEYYIAANNTEILGFKGGLRGVVSQLCDKRGEWVKVSTIDTCITERSFICFTTANTVTSTKSETFILKNLQNFDLTLMFGYGNEPATVEEFEDWLSKNVGLAPYYAYNACTLINSKPTGMASIGYNLMELDGSTGTAKVPGIYSDTYSPYYGIRGSYSSVSFVPAATGISETITPDADGKFEITVPGDIVVSGAGSSTTVFMWYDGSYTDGNVGYEKVETTGLDVTKIYGKANGSSTYTQVFPYGIKGIGNTHDVLDLKNAEAIVNIARIPLNDDRLNIQMKGGATHTWYSWFLHSYAPESEKWKVNGSILCDGYGVGNSADIYSNMTKDGICVGDSGYLGINDSSYNGTGTKPYLSKTLYYELLNPITYTDLIVSNDGGETGTPVQVFNYTVDNWGLEELLPQNDYATVNGMATTAPILNVRYSIDAVEAINTLNDEVADLYESKANADGIYPSMTVGTAQNLEGNQVISDPFMFRTSGGEADFSDGLASLQQIDGGSVKFHQYNQIRDYSGSSYGVTASGSSSTQIITITVSSGGPTARASFDFINQSHNNNTGDIVYCKTYPLDSASANIMTGRSQGLFIHYTPQLANFTKYGAIGTIQSPYNNSCCQIYVGTEVPEGTYRYQGNFFNLTELFGRGNEPSTVSAFEEWLSTHIGLKSYYPYTTGILLNSQLTALESIGFNQWDEEWKLGNIIDGVEQPTGTQVINDGYIPILANTEYYLSFTGSMARYYYDSNKTFITGTTFNTPSTDTTPSNACYMRFKMNSEYGTTYNNDICINLSWDGSRDGEYEPYEKYSLDLPVTTITGINPVTNEREAIFPDGFKSAGNIRDSIYIEGGVTKAVKNIGSVILDKTQGTWRTDSTSGDYVAYNVLSGAAETGSGIIGIVGGISLVNGTSYPQGILIPYTTFTDLDAFKNRMDGTPVNYQLAEPIIYTDLQYEDGTPFSLPKSIQVSNWGTEMIEPQNESTLSTCAPTLSLKYAIDAVEAIDTLQNDGIMYYDLKDNMQNFLAALNQALDGIGTISISQNPTDKVYSFTFTEYVPET